MKFDVNVGGTDRTLRIVIGALLILLALTGTIGTWGWLGVLPLASGLMRHCPVYKVLGKNTATPV